jgi:hypothetical protein
MTQQDIVARWRAAQAKEQETFIAWMAVKDIDLKKAAKLSQTLAQQQATTQSWFKQLESARAA